MSKTPRRRLTFCTMATALTLTAAAPTQPDLPGLVENKEALAELRRTAAALPFVMHGDLSFGRAAYGPAPRAAMAAYRAAVAAAQHAAFNLRAGAMPDLAGLPSLLEDDAPKVRLMAAFALFWSCQPTTLTVLAEHVDDRGEIPSLGIAHLTSQMADARRKALPDLEKTTVGAEVRSFLRAWGAPEPGTEAFAQWARRQQDLAPTTAELRLRLLLATGGTTPIDTPSHEMLEVLRHTQLARHGARELAFIALFHDKTETVVQRWPTIVRDQEFAARRLGHDNLLRILGGEAPLIDGKPLPPENVDGFLEPVQHFLLARPVRVGLRPADADTLITLGKKTYRLALFRAAARLQPDRATEILRSALATDTQALRDAIERVNCAILLWDLRGAENRAFLTRWFYEQPEARHTFLVHLLSRFGDADKAMFAQLVTDPRFATVGPDALLVIVHTLNLTRMEPVITPRMMMNFMHPSGLANAFRNLEGAKKAWPQQTKEMVDRMADWRQHIRAYVAPWAGED